MSIQFGKWNVDGRPVGNEELDKVRRILAPFASDDKGSMTHEGLAILHHAFHTTHESYREKQPVLLPSGVILTWDGRLDNREALMSELGPGTENSAPDSEIVAAAYERWQTKALSKVIGDWALSAWDPNDGSLLLAKDFVGVRQLYYRIEKNTVSWCSILDVLVLLADHGFELDEEYVCGWLALFPAAHLTPYVGIQSVPPSSFVRITRRRHDVVKYWDFDPDRAIRYRKDEEYEEHFRTLFAESVRRRLRSTCPVLAELSGGMDSSSIVCIADQVTGAPLVHTVSYYSDNEPNWNEKPFFTAVEQRRGKVGLHIDVGSASPELFDHNEDCFSSVPDTQLMSGEARKSFDSHIALNGYRVLLCGIGGDEVLGGVPTPIPELADLLAGGRLFTLARQLKRWALSRRKPWVWLLAETLRQFFPQLGEVPQHKRPQSWLHPRLIEQYASAFAGDEKRITFW